MFWRGFCSGGGVVCWGAGGGGGGSFFFCFEEDFVAVADFAHDVGVELLGHRGKDVELHELVDELVGFDAEFCGEVFGDDGGFHAQAAWAVGLRWGGVGGCGGGWPGLGRGRGWWGIGGGGCDGSGGAGWGGDWSGRGEGSFVWGRCGCGGGFGVVGFFGVGQGDGRFGRGDGFAFGLFVGFGFGQG
jgi:hypothetical protein